MKKICWIFLLAVAFCSQISCKKDSTTSGGSTTTTILNHYPFRIGNKWEYDVRLMLISGASTQIYYEHSINKIDSMITLNGIDSVFNISAYDSAYDNGNTWLTNNFYYQDHAGVFNVAYNGAPTRVFLRHLTNSTKRILFNDQLYSFNDFYRLIHLENSSDSLIIENTPLLTLKFPVTNGQSWEYRHVNNPFGIYRTYNGTSNVQTSSGTFPCQIVKITWDMNNDGTIDTTLNELQFVSSQKGLVKTTFTGSGLTLTDSLGNPTGTGTWVEECTLSRVNF